jgi:hypothetical protein
VSCSRVSSAGWTCKMTASNITAADAARQLLFVTLLSFSRQSWAAGDPNFCKMLYCKHCLVSFVCVYPRTHYTHTTQTCVDMQYRTVKDNKHIRK